MILPFIGGLLKTVLVGAAGAAVGNAIQRKHDEKSRQAEYDFYKEQGATLPEIMGQGVGGGSGHTAQVMGNQLNNFLAQEKQQKYEQEQRNLDRMTQLTQTQMQTDAQKYGADLAASTAKAGQQNQFEIALMNADLRWQELHNKWAVDNPALNMKLKQMSMGPDNAILEMVLTKHGVTLSGKPEGVTDAEYARRMNRAMDEFSLRSGNMPKVMGTGAQNIGDVFKMPSMGNPADLQPSMPYRSYDFTN